MTDAFVHLRVPAALKASWLRQSRAAGMRLTDWIVQRVEAQPTDKNHGLEPVTKVQPRP